MCFDDQGLHRYMIGMNKAMTAEDRQTSCTEWYRLSLMIAGLLKFKQSQDRLSICDDGKWT